MLLVENTCLAYWFFFFFFVIVIFVFEVIKHYGLPILMHFIPLRIPGLLFY